MMSDLTLLRKIMDAELKKNVIPILRQLGFKGSFPHFRRAAETAIELITFQFDRNGGGFVIEIARCSLSGTVTDWGKHIPPEKVTAWDLHPNSRKRLQPKQGSGPESWYRYDRDPVSKIAAEVSELLQQAEIWDDVEISTSFTSTWPIP